MAILMKAATSLWKIKKQPENLMYFSKYHQGTKWFTVNNMCQECYVNKWFKLHLFTHFNRFVLESISSSIGVELYSILIVSLLIQTIAQCLFSYSWPKSNLSKICYGYFCTENQLESNTTFTIISNIINYKH